MKTKTLMVMMKKNRKELRWERGLTRKSKRGRRKKKHNEKRKEGKKE